MSTRRHVYTLAISMAGCRFDVRVNDVPVLRDVIDGWPLTATMAVNEYLAPGRNELSFELTPRPGCRTIDAPAEALEIALLGRSAAASKQDDIPLLLLRIRPGTLQGEPVELKDRGSEMAQIDATSREQDGDRLSLLRFRISFSISSDSFGWRWLSSARVEAGVQTQASLTALFSDWVERLRRGDLAWLPAVMAERNAELTSALFEPRDAVERHGLYDAVDDPTLSLCDPDLRHAKLLVVGGGKLARLVRWDETPIIAYAHADQRTANYYPFTFRREGSAWVVCR